MSILLQNDPLAYDIKFTEDELIVYLKDGRSLYIPLVWFILLNSESRGYVILKVKKKLGMGQPNEEKLKKKQEKKQKMQTMQFFCLY